MRLIYARVLAIMIISGFALIQIPSNQNLARAQAATGGPEKPLPGRGDTTPIPSAVNALIPSSGTNITGLETWTKIAYQSFQDGNWEIYIANGDGNGAANVTRHSASDYGSKVDHGATRLVFVSNRDLNSEIYTAQINGANQTRLTYNEVDDYAPDWSPDGDRIIFVSERDGNSNIYVMNADGSGQTQLTESRKDDTNPAWSPDGQQIAWVQIEESGGAVWLMNADGSNAHELISERPYLGSVAWSPSGDKLITDFDGDHDYWNELMVYTFWNQGLVELYDAGDDFVDIWTGSYSPDGEWVLYNRIEYGVSGNQLYIDKAYLEMRRPDSYGSSIRLPGYGVELSADWESADLLPPVSQVLRLPEHMYQGEFEVTWNGEDHGPAGITSYELQYKIGESGAWTDWYLENPLNLYTMFSLGVPGDRLFFRSRARDDAGHFELWPINPSGDTSTLLFTWNMSGVIHDNRGVPLTDIPIEISPAPVDVSVTDNLGKYGAWLGQTGGHTLQVSSDGYSAFPPGTVNANSDIVHDIYLPPLDNVLSNGGFENNLSNWTISATIEITQAVSQSHSGDHALRLNEPCPAPCFTPSMRTYIFYDVAMAITQDEELYLIYATSFGNQKALYSTSLQVDGTWTNPVMIGTFPDTSLGERVKLVVDGHNNLHAVWMGGDGLYFSRKALGGPWSWPGRIGAGLYPDIAADQSGGLHVVYTNNSSVQYIERSPDGTWSPPIHLSGLSGYNHAGIAVGPDGAVHFIWQEMQANEFGIYFSSRLPDGSYTPKKRLINSSGYSSQPLQIAVGPAGDVHAFWSEGHSGYYAYRPGSDNWFTVRALPDSYGPAEISVDSRGVLSMIGNHYGSSVYFRSKDPTSGWSDTVELFNSWGDSLFTIDQKDRLHMVFQNPDYSMGWAYVTILRADQDEIILAEQQVTVPSTAHHPTLSFFYKMDNFLPSGDSIFNAYVVDDVETTPVFTASTNRPWTQAWIDLEPWVGETITITLGVEQAQGEPIAQVLIDDVSLGSWLTPVVSGVAPSSFISDWTAETITITGTNFISGAAVFLRDTPLNHVVWIDENTLQASLPSGMPAGNYELWVMNPGLQRSPRFRSVVLGQFVYLPMLSR